MHIRHVPKPPFSNRILSNRISPRMTRGVLLCAINTCMYNEQALKLHTSHPIPLNLTKRCKLLLLIASLITSPPCLLPHIYKGRTTKRRKNLNRSQQLGRSTAHSPVFERRRLRRVLPMHELDCYDGCIDLPYSCPYSHLVSRMEQ